MAQKEVYDLVIIGGGPGGMTAGIYAKRAVMKTVMVEKGVQGGQVVNTDEVENWPGIQSISGAELSMRFAEHVGSYDLEVISREVSSVEAGEDVHTVVLDNGSRLATHTVIIATGGSLRKIGVPGEDENFGRGVSYCATCDGFFFRGKQVIVIGGGDTAVEEALYLSKLTQKVYLAHRRDELRAEKLLRKRIMEEEKIEILWNTVPTEIIFDDTGVTGIGLADTVSGEKRKIDIDGVFVFIGFDPNNVIVPAGVALSKAGYVITNQNCETSIPGIYVVGDLRKKLARQIVTAAGDGCTAAMAASHYVENKKAAT